jgi:MFS family permease
MSLLVLGLGLAIVIIDGTIVNVVLPSISRDFNANLRDLQWVNSLYALVYAALIVTFGRIGDQFGRRLLFVIGVLVFVAFLLVDESRAAARHADIGILPIGVGVGALVLGLIQGQTYGWIRPTAGSPSARGRGLSDPSPYLLRASSSLCWAPWGSSSGSVALRQKDMSPPSIWASCDHQGIVRRCDPCGRPRGGSVRSHGGRELVAHPGHTAAVPFTA